MRDQRDRLPSSIQIREHLRGTALRFGLEGLVEPSTRTGRRYARPSESAEIVGVARFSGSEVLIAATAQARGILANGDEKLRAAMVRYQADLALQVRDKDAKLRNQFDAS